ncbi:hypothetical protein FRC11_008109, partial [Ceratobasidium sp. 423]
VNGFNKDSWRTVPPLNSTASSGLTCTFLIQDMQSYSLTSNAVTANRNNSTPEPVNAAINQPFTGSTTRLSQILANDDDIEIKTLLRSIQHETFEYQAWVTRGAPPEEAVVNMRGVAGACVTASTGTTTRKPLLAPPRATRCAPHAPTDRPALRLAIERPIKGHIEDWTPTVGRH